LSPTFAWLSPCNKPIGGDVVDAKARSGIRYAEIRPGGRHCHCPWSNGEAAWWMRYLEQGPPSPAITSAFGLQPGSPSREFRETTPTPGKNRRNRYWKANRRPRHTPECDRRHLLSSTPHLSRGSRMSGHLNARTSASRRARFSARLVRPRQSTGHRGNVPTGGAARARGSVKIAKRSRRSTVIVQPGGAAAAPAWFWSDSGLISPSHLAGGHSRQ